MLTLKKHYQEEKRKREEAERKLSELEEAHKKVLLEHKELDRTYTYAGGTLKGKPVIPEYMGFVERMTEESRVYERDDAMMFKTDKWHVIKSGQRYEIYPHDQLEMLHFLKVIGVDIDVERYLRGDFGYR